MDEYPVRQFHPILVLGMHRSGTSCLTGILEGFGVHLGHVLKSNSDNTKGNRENPRVMALNESLLEANGGSWRDPVLVRRCSMAHRHQRELIFRRLAGNQVDWGFKDPRLLFTLPFWQEASEPRCIGTFRHPLRVALSLQHRQSSGMPFMQGLQLWYRYNLRLLQLHRRAPFPLVDFDLPEKDYVEDAVIKLLKLGLDAGRVNAATAFFDHDLRHQTCSNIDDTKLPAPVQSLYEDLLQAHADGT